jgi:hypothetical protein
VRWRYRQRPSTSINDDQSLKAVTLSASSTWIGVKSYKEIASAEVQPEVSTILSKHWPTEISSRPIISWSTSWNRPTQPLSGEHNSLSIFVPFGLENRDFGRRDPSRWPRGTNFVDKRLSLGR